MSRASVLAVEDTPKPASVSSPVRLERSFAAHHPLVWRTLRRLGLAPADAAEATRRVFLEAAQHGGHMSPGRERVVLLELVLAYAFDVDCFASSEVRARPAPSGRGTARSRLFRRASAPADAARVELMDRVLSHMPRPEATAFILYELEGVPLAEVAQLLSLDVEAGRRLLLHARAEFKAIVAALRPAARG